jgi:hypothetical protein
MHQQPAASSQPQMGQILRYTERQSVSNHLTTDNFHRQRLRYQTGNFSSGGFMAHRKPNESEDEPEVSRVPAEKLVRDIRCATRKHHSAEDKIRIVPEGLGSKESIENNGK